jgi:DNA (cytosine-5)-methyltransferase 1
MTKLKLLDLFSGIGGFSLGLERTGGFETVAFCEYDEKAQKVLKKHWPDVPIYKDVRTLDYDGTVDIITGGFPCQPFSVAGKQKGKDDDRHLWPAMFKLIQKHRPTWVIGENVAGLIALGLDSVLADLESENYRTRTFVIPACSVNAKHRRDRLWIIGERVVGNTKHDGSSTSKVRRGTIKTSIDNTKGQSKTFEFEGTSKPKHDEVMENTRHRTGGSSERESVGRNGKRKHETEVGSSGTVKVARSSKASEDVADTNSTSRARGRASIGFQTPLELDSISKCKRGEITGNSGHWGIEPSVGRVANGIPRRMDRLKQLGNAVVPQIPEIIGNAILEAEKLES